MTASNYVHITVDKIHLATNKAIQVEIDGELIWLPKTQIADIDDCQVGDEGVEISITKWIAREKGIAFDE